jgi:hypothetical protein
LYGDSEENALTAQVPSATVTEMLPASNTPSRGTITSEASRNTTNSSFYPIPVSGFTATVYDIITGFSNAMQSAGQTSPTVDVVQAISSVQSTVKSGVPASSTSVDIGGLTIRSSSTTSLVDNMVSSTVLQNRDNEFSRSRSSYKDSFSTSSGQLGSQQPNTQSSNGGVLVSSVTTSGQIHDFSDNLIGNSDLLSVTPVSISSDHSPSSSYFSGVSAVASVGYSAHSLNPKSQYTDSPSSKNGSSLSPQNQDGQSTNIQKSTADLNLSVVSETPSTSSYRQKDLNSTSSYLNGQFPVSEDVSKASTLLSTSQDDHSGESPETIISSSISMHSQNNLSSNFQSGSSVSTVPHVSQNTRESTMTPLSPVSSTNQSYQSTSFSVSDKSSSVAANSPTTNIQASNVASTRFQTNDWTSTVASKISTSIKSISNISFVPVTSERNLASDFSDSGDYSTVSLVSRNEQSDYTGNASRLPSVSVSQNNQQLSSKTSNWTTVVSTLSIIDPQLVSQNSSGMTDTRPTDHDVQLTSFLQSSSQSSASLLSTQYSEVPGSQQSNPISVISSPSHNAEWSDVQNGGSQTTSSIKETATQNHQLSQNSSILSNATSSSRGFYTASVYDDIRFTTPSQWTSPFDQTTAAQQRSNSVTISPLTQADKLSSIQASTVSYEASFSSRAQGISVGPSYAASASQNGQLLGSTNKNALSTDFSNSQNGSQASSFTEIATPIYQSSTFLSDSNVNTDMQSHNSELTYSQNNNQTVTLSAPSPNSDPSAYQRSEQTATSVVNVLSRINETPEYNSSASTAVPPYQSFQTMSSYANNGASASSQWNRSTLASNGMPSPSNPLTVPPLTQNVRPSSIPTVDGTLGFTTYKYDNNDRSLYTPSIGQNTSSKRNELSTDATDNKSGLPTISSDFVGVSTLTANYQSATFLQSNNGSNSQYNRLTATVPAASRTSDSYVFPNGGQYSASSVNTVTQNRESSQDNSAPLALTTSRQTVQTTTVFAVFNPPTSSQWTRSASDQTVSSQFSNNPLTVSAMTPDGRQSSFQTIVGESASSFKAGFSTRIQGSSARPSDSSSVSQDDWSQSSPKSSVPSTDATISQADMRSAFGSSNGFLSTQHSQFVESTTFQKSSKGSSSVPLQSQFTETSNEQNRITTSTVSGDSQIGSSYGFQTNKVASTAHESSPADQSLHSSNGMLSFSSGIQNNQATTVNSSAVFSTPYQSDGYENVSHFSITSTLHSPSSNSVINNESRIPNYESDSSSARQYNTEQFNTLTSNQNHHSSTSRDNTDITAWLLTKQTGSLINSSTSLPDYVSAFTGYHNTNTDSLFNQNSLNSDLQANNDVSAASTHNVNSQLSSPNEASGSDLSTTHLVVNDGLSSSPFNSADSAASWPSYSTPSPVSTRQFASTLGGNNYGESATQQIDNHLSVSSLYIGTTRASSTAVSSNIVSDSSSSNNIQGLSSQTTPYATVPERTDQTNTVWSFAGISDNRFVSTAASSRSSSSTKFISEQSHFTVSPSLNGQFSSDTIGHSSTIAVESDNSIDPEMTSFRQPVNFPTNTATSKLPSSSDSDQLYSFNGSLYTTLGLNLQTSSLGADYGKTTANRQNYSIWSIFPSFSETSKPPSFTTQNVQSSAYVSSPDEHVSSGYETDVSVGRSSPVSHINSGSDSVATSIPVTFLANLSANSLPNYNAVSHDASSTVSSVNQSSGLTSASLWLSASQSDLLNSSTSTIRIVSNVTETRRLSSFSSDFGESIFNTHSPFSSDPNQNAKSTEYSRLQDSGATVLPSNVSTVSPSNQRSQSAVGSDAATSFAARTIKFPTFQTSGRTPAGSSAYFTGQSSRSISEFELSTASPLTKSSDTENLTQQSSDVSGSILQRSTDGNGRFTSSFQRSLSSSSLNIATTYVTVTSTLDSTNLIKLSNSSQQVPAVTTYSNVHLSNSASNEAESVTSTQRNTDRSRGSVDSSGASVTVSSSDSQFGRSSGYMMNVTGGQWSASSNYSDQPRLYNYSSTTPPDFRSSSESNVQLSTASNVLNPSNWSTSTTARRTNDDVKTSYVDWTTNTTANFGGNIAAPTPWQIGDYHIILTSAIKFEK